jgi:hypothetical protein
MTRLAIVAVALLVCVTGLDFTLLGAGEAASWLRTHMPAPWFVPACNLVTVVFLAFAGLRRKKAAAEDERMTPLVRRDPKTGLRQL